MCKNANAFLVAFLVVFQIFSKRGLMALGPTTRFQMHGV